MTTPDPLPEVHLLYNPKRWVCLPASFAEPKYLEAEIEIGMVFIKTRKPNYKSANNVGEVGNIIIFPFYWCSTKGVHYWGGGTPTEGNFSFEKWFEQFGKNYRIPVEVVPVEVAVADQELERCMRSTYHYEGLANGNYKPPLFVSTWAREKIWNPLVNKCGWSVVDTSNAFKTALLPFADRAVTHWEGISNPKFDYSNPTNYPNHANDFLIKKLLTKCEHLSIKTTNYALDA